MIKCYQIVETCPMWNDGSGRPYVRKLPTIFLDKTQAEQCKEDLDIITCEKVTCLEYEIIELDLCSNYEEEDIDILGYFNYQLLHK
jgi:hypothetical protein